MSIQTKLPRIGAWMLLCTVLFIAFWIRIRDVNMLPEEQFTGTDPYLYYWQAQIISENGQLPARDMHRWLPLGRDLGQALNLYSYVLAYAHKAITRVFRNISLYHITLYAPVVCFIVGLGVLCLFLYRTFGFLFSSIVGVLLATLPGTIDRSTAGFSDRDSWCLMLGILAVTTYLTSLQAQYPRRRFLWTLASGFSVFLGGISWEGFGVFLSIILIVEVWRFLTSETENGLVLYLIMVLTFVPTLWFASPAYRSGQGFATHLFAFVLIPPLVLLALRTLRYVLITKAPFAEKLCPHSRTLALGLTLVSIGIALGYVFTQHHTFASTTVPLSQNALMQAIGELEAPDYNYWVSRYGSVFIIGSMGLLIASIRLWKKQGAGFAVALAFFCLVTFFREPLNTLWVESPVNTFFGIATVGCAIMFLLVAWQRKTPAPNELTFISIVAWFLSWSALSRDALRYDFFIGIPLAFFTAALIQFLSSWISKKLRHSAYTTDKFRQDIPHALLKTGFAAFILALLMFWPPTGAYTKRSLFAATQMRSAIPGNTHTLQALRWMKAELPRTTVMAASPGYGSQLNVLGGVKTITDQDHYIQHWIYLYYRHVFCAHEEREALEFLRTHGATHLMLTEKDFNHSATYAFIGGYQNAKQFKLIRLQITPQRIGEPQRLTGLKPTPFASITFDSAQPASIIARLKTGKIVNLPYVAFRETQRETYQTETEIENPHGGVVLYFDRHSHLKKAYYLPTASWNSLACRLYIHGQMPDVFVQVYPTDKDAAAGVKVWEIHYPPDIKTNPKYLATEPGE